MANRHFQRQPGRLLHAPVKPLCLLLALLILGPFAACKAQEQPRDIIIEVVIIKGYKRERGQTTKLIRWPVEAVIQYDGREYPVTQGTEEGSVSHIRVRPSRALREFKVTVKGRPDAKLKKVVTAIDTNTGNTGGEADETGTVRVKLVTRCLIHVVFDMPDDPGTEKLRRLPIIFLPGVAGTQLWQKGRGENHQVWPFVAPPPLGGNRFNMMLDQDGIGNADKVFIGDILRSGLVNFYGGMINFLVGQGYKENTDLFIFPYDWRLDADSPKHFDRLDQLVKDAIQKTDAKKVVLLAHSLGGVVARAYLITRPESATKVDALISMGTPYFGSVKPYYALLDGYDFDNPEVTQKTMKILARNFPAAHFLLPQLPFMHDTDGRELSLDESFSVQYRGYLKGKGGIDDYTATDNFIWNINGTIMERAKKFWARMGTAQNPTPLPAGVKHYVIIGCGNRTMDGYQLRLADNPTSERPTDPTVNDDGFMLGNKKVVGEPLWGDGDITVPLLGAQIKTADATYYIRFRREADFINTSSSYGLKVSSQHGDLPKNPTVQRIVWEIIEGNPPETQTYSKPTKYDFETTDFSLHSDAHMSITDDSGGRLGFNSKGGIDRTLPTGSFLAIGEAEYASVANGTGGYKVAVEGIRDGKFTLDVNIKRPDGTATPFSYREVPVKKGTVATVTVTPAQAVTAPPLSVTTAGKTTTVTATVGTTQGSSNDGGIAISDNGQATGPTVEGQTGTGTMPGETLQLLDVRLEIGQKDGKIVITSTANNPFAAILQLRVGDRVLSIDGKSTEGLSLDQARALMRGGAGAKADMALTILRSLDGEQITLTMPRDRNTATTGSSTGTSTVTRNASGGDGSARTTAGSAVSEANRKQAEQFIDRGMAFSTDGEWAQAEAEYRKALRLDPTRHDGWLMLGEACMEQKKWPEAVTVYRELVKLKPNSGANHADLAQALLKQGKRAEAIREAKEAIRLGEEEHPVFDELGLTVTPATR